MDLGGKKALITGGAVRLGRAIGAALAARGAEIVIHYRTSAGPAEAFRDELAAGGTRAWLVQADLVSEAACRRVVEEARQAAGGLDILVNNAAVFHRHPLGEVTEQTVLAEFWPNLFAPMFLIRFFARAAGSGRIVNMLDRRITSHDTSCVPYLLSKRALHELTLLAALELAPGFSVNAVAPGVLLPPPGQDAGYLAEHGGRVPLDHPCTPEDIARAVVYLVESDALTGQVIFVDGGKHLLGADDG